MLYMRAEQVVARAMYREAGFECVRPVPGESDADEVWQRWDEEVWTLDFVTT